MKLRASTLVITTRNRPKLLFDTVASVLQGTALPDELIIIDQSDTPHPEIVQKEVHAGCQIRYIHSRTRGVSRGRNEGMALANNEILVLIDDDMLAPSDWYQTLIEAVNEAGPQAVVTGQVLPGDEEVQGGFVPAIVNSTEPRIYSGRIGTDVLPSCHMAMFRPVFSTVGGFDERVGPGTPFPAADDNDYGFRLLEAGYQIVYAPQATLYHRAWRGDREYFRLRRDYGRGKGGFYTKYWSVRDPYIFRRMVKDIASNLVRFPWRVLHRPILALGDLWYVCGILLGCAQWLIMYGVGQKSWKQLGMEVTRTVPAPDTTPEVIKK